MNKDKNINKDKNMNYDYAIYHKNCPDGFSSLIVLLKSTRLTHNAIIYHDVPSASHPPDNIDNKNIIIMDVAYKYEVLKEIIKRARTVVFIDHHVTIKNDVEKLISEENNKKKVQIIYDEKESGASLTWKFFFKSQRIPLFIKYIRDNDIGAWKLKYTKPFIYALRVKYSIDLKSDIIKNWLELFDNDVVKQIVQRGILYEEYAESLLEENSRKYSLESFPSQKIYDMFKSHFTKPGQYKVAVFCGSGCPSSSLLGNRLMRDVNCDFAIIWTYHMEKKEYILSFRSDDTDVGKISTLFGGGGHKHASACSFPSSRLHIQDLFFPKSLQRELKNK
jgi:oligoribonuclease NrnB/cAMP/cGMP phosphodiesterase (DHH superfamily)